VGQEHLVEDSDNQKESAPRVRALFFVNCCLPTGPAYGGSVRARVPHDNSGCHPGGAAIGVKFILHQVSLIIYTSNRFICNCLQDMQYKCVNNNLQFGGCVLGCSWYN
jgi:hypothetical protein